MASKVGICNRALQHLGAPPLVSLDDDHPNARRCNVAYEPRRDALLRAHPWSFARARTILAAETTTPAFGYDKQFQLPSDFARIIGPTTDLDCQIEGRKLLANDSSFNLVYVRKVEDEGEFDPLFAEALAADIAYNICELVTQSSTKKQDVGAFYEEMIREAKRTNAIERVARVAVEDPFITARL